LKNKLLFVVRGTLVEKSGDYDEPGPKIIFKKGNIAHLRKTIEVDEGHGNANIFVGEETMASIVALDTDSLKEITQTDKCNYYPKIWRKVASRVIILSIKELGEDNVF
jgi:hypothetical protein